MSALKRNTTFIGFGELSSYKSVQYSLFYLGQCSISLFFVGHQEGSTVFIRL